MDKRFVLPLLLGCYLTSPAHAITNGLELSQKCPMKGDQVDLLTCQQYVEGVVDAIMFTDQAFGREMLFCVDRPGIKLGDVVLAVRLWIVQHPERATQDAVSVNNINMALVEYFPCK